MFGYPKTQRLGTWTLCLGPQQLLFLSGFRDGNGKPTRGFLGLESNLGKRGPM